MDWKGISEIESVRKEPIMRGFGERASDSGIITFRQEKTLIWGVFKERQGEGRENLKQATDWSPKWGLVPDAEIMT